MLYQYDSAGKALGRVAVGSLGGHTSRNVLAGGRGAAYPIDIGTLQNVLLYGSITRDNAGRMYLGGWTAAGGRGRRPLMLQITPRQ